MIRGDVLSRITKDWTDGDVVFANSTCFDDELMQQICNIARKYTLYQLLRIIV